ncbi:MAG: hypothetical protein M3M85_04085 [bacterium]|nr:hypothetical protein [bacterium]
MRKLKKLKNLKLTDFEKRQLFTRVQSSIKKLPDSGDVNLRYPVPSPFFRFAFLPHTAFMKVGVLALLILTLSGATAYASLGSLPGDLLYGVKVNVVEKVSKLAALSPESRARAETEHIERRIAEFEILAGKGKLTEARTRVIEENIDERLKDFDRSVLDIKEKSGNDKKQTREEKDLDSKLEKHAENIIKIREGRSPDKRALEAVLERVEARRDEREKERKERGEDDNDEERNEDEEDFENETREAGDSGDSDEEDRHEDREIDIGLPII